MVGSSSREAGAEWITAEAAASWLRNDLGEKDKEGEVGFLTSIFECLA